MLNNIKMKIIYDNKKIFFHHDTLYNYRII